jgi:hypothetical protein
MANKTGARAFGGMRLDVLAGGKGRRTQARIMMQRMRKSTIYVLDIPREDMDGDLSTTTTRWI